jgi:hypothetical protein
MLKIGFSSKKLTRNCLTDPSCWNLQKAEGMSFVVFKKKKHDGSFAPFKKKNKTDPGT